MIPFSLEYEENRAKTGRKIVEAHNVCLKILQADTSCNHSIVSLYRYSVIPFSLEYEENHAKTGRKIFETPNDRLQPPQEEDTPVTLQLFCYIVILQICINPR